MVDVKVELRKVSIELDKETKLIEAAKSEKDQVLDKVIARLKASPIGVQFEVAW